MYLESFYFYLVKIFSENELFSYVNFVISTAKAQRFLHFFFAEACSYIIFRLF